VVVLDKYQRRCAVTAEKTVPTLEAAHIRWFSDQPEHAVQNGILLRADLHRLLDSGYATITPDYHFLTSRRIREDFDNGIEYARLNGSTIHLPENPRDHPSAEILTWHNENRFLT
jgi:putative restriction endonuclease